MTFDINKHTVVTQQTIEVSHNMEVAHRLSQLPGKCQQIHGHGMQVHLQLTGKVDELGIFAGIDFSSLKKVFRAYIDETYDHHLLLNCTDPWASPIYMFQGMDRVQMDSAIASGDQHFLPGLVMLPADPTTENLSKWIATDMATKLIERGWNENVYDLTVVIDETCTNAASTTVTVNSNFVLDRIEITE